jgi:hypothetical protein
MFTSLVQAFDEHGEGLVFRGPDFEWIPEQHESKTPHLKMEDAMKLVQFALAKYSMEMHQLPSRVVIHKSSRWTHEEKTGIHEGLREKVGRYDLIALQRQDSVRLITASKYPPLRGTRNPHAYKDELERCEAGRIVADHSGIRPKSFRYYERNPNRRRPSAASEVLQLGASMPTTAEVSVRYCIHVIGLKVSF